MYTCSFSQNIQLSNRLLLLDKHFLFTFFILWLIQTSADPVLACEFHPGDKNIIVTCGKGHISFWNFENNLLSKKQGIYEVS